MNDFEKDLEDFIFLSELLEKGKIKYIEDDQFVFEKIITAYPIIAYRIDWNRIPHEVYHISEPYPESKLAIQHHVSNIITSKKMKLSEEVYLCFDGHTKGGLSMPIGVLMNNAGEIFTLPQRAYVIPDNANWCMNYTFEDFLYFGCSPKSTQSLRRPFHKLQILSPRCPEFATQDIRR